MGMLRKGDSITYTTFPEFGVGLITSINKRRMLAIFNHGAVKFVKHHQQFLKLHKTKEQRFRELEASIENWKTEDEKRYQTPTLIDG